MSIDMIATVVGDTADTSPWDVWDVTLGLPQDECPGCGVLVTFTVNCCGFAIAVLRQELWLFRLKSVESWGNLLILVAPSLVGNMCCAIGLLLRKPFINIYYALIYISGLYITRFTPFLL